MLKPPFIQANFKLVFINDTLLEEINDLAPKRDKVNILESRGTNAISAIMNVFLERGWVAIGERQAIRPEDVKSIVKSAY